MCDGHSPAVERCPKETREELVPYTEDEEGEKPRHVHVRVGGTVHDPGGMNGHG
jgi:hypothetical protein